MRRVGVVLLLLIGIGVWCALTGYYQLTAGEAAVILRLGRFARLEPKVSLVLTGLGLLLGVITLIAVIVEA